MPNYPASIDVRFNDGGSAAKAAALSTSVQGSLNSISGAATRVASASLAMGAAIVAGMGMAGKASRDFEQAFREITTLMNDTQIAEWADSFRSEIVDLSEQVGRSSTDMARGMYQIVSAGFSGAGALDILRQSGYAAVGALTTTETAVDGVTGVMNAFSSQGITAAKASDLLFLTVKYGKTRFDELSHSIGMYGSFAAAAGVSAEEMLAAQAALTTQNIDVARSATYLAAILKSIVKPQDDAKEAAARYGVELSSTALATKGLVGVLNEMRDKTGGNIDAMSAMFTELEAFRAAVALTTTANGKMNETLGAMKTETGATAEAFGKVFNTSAAQLVRLSASWDNLKQAIGDVVNEDLAPMIDKLTEAIQKSREWVTENKAWVQTWVDVSIKAAEVFAIVGTGALVLKGIIGTVNLIRSAWLLAAGAVGVYKAATVGAAATTVGVGIGAGAAGVGAGVGAAVGAGSAAGGAAAGAGGAAAGSAAGVGVLGGLGVAALAVGALYVGGATIREAWLAYIEGKKAAHDEENAAKDMKAKMVRDGISEEDAQAVADGEMSPLDAIRRAKKKGTYKKPGLRPQLAPTAQAPAKPELPEAAKAEIARQQQEADAAARKALEDKLKQQQRALQVAEAQAQTEQLRLDLVRAGGGSKQAVAAQTTRLEAAQRTAQQQALAVAQTQAKLDGDRTAILLTQQQIEQQNLQLRIDAANQQEREQQNREKAAQDEIQRLQTILGLRRQYGIKTAWDSAQTSSLTTGGHDLMPGGPFGLAGNPWGRGKSGGGGSARWGQADSLVGSLGGAMRASDAVGGWKPDALRAQVEVQFHVMVDSIAGMDTQANRNSLAGVMNDWLHQARAGGRL